MKKIVIKCKELREGKIPPSTMRKLERTKAYLLNNKKRKEAVFE